MKILHTAHATFYRRLHAVRARSDAGMTSAELAVLTAILLTVASAVALALTGKVNDLISNFQSK